MSCQTISTIRTLAASTYELTFAEGSEVAERVIFPAGPTESRGMEDARFVRFTRPLLRHLYGVRRIPDPPATARDPGLPLVPDSDALRSELPEQEDRPVPPDDRRSLGGLARYDNENNYLMLSDEVRSWHDVERIQVPCRPWELVQIGNCGSPVEPEAAW